MWIVESKQMNDEALKLKWNLDMINAFNIYLFIQ